MNQVLAIARNTFREAIRDRVLYLLVFFAILIILGSELIAVLAVGSPERVVVDLGLGAIAFFGALLAVLLGLSMVSREIERRTVYAVLSKPVSRAQFLIGKLLGLMGTLAMLVSAMSFVFLGFLWLRYEIFHSGLLVALGLSLVEDLVIACFALLFSSFTTPILGTLFTMTVYVVGHLSYGLKLLARFPQVAESGWHDILLALYYILPNLERFNIRDAALHADPLGFGYVAFAVAYGVGYALGVLALAVTVFARRDLV